MKKFLKINDNLKVLEDKYRDIIKYISTLEKNKINIEYYENNKSGAYDDINYQANLDSFFKEFEEITPFQILLHLNKQGLADQNVVEE